MKTLTASTRSALIRLASTLPKGSSDRKVILAGLKKARMAPGLKRIVDNAVSKMERQLASVTLNDGSDAHSDLDKLSNLAAKARNEWLMDAIADFGSDAVEPLMDALDELMELIEETQRGLDDEGFLEDEVDEDAVMEYMEDRMADIETLIEDLPRA